MALERDLGVVGISRTISADWPFWVVRSTRCCVSIENRLETEYHTILFLKKQLNLVQSCLEQNI